MPVILGCTLIFVFLLRYEIRKNSKPGKETVDAFLHREFEANTTRKKDISSLPYLIADTSRLPEISCPDPEGEIEAVYKKLQAMHGMKLLNLSNLSNTDLKLEYGAANFPVLSECDARYTAFTRGLYQLGSLLRDAGEEDAAIQALNYALELHTDIAATYRLLGSMLAARGNAQALDALKKEAAQLPELTRESVCHYLNGL